MPELPEVETVARGLRAALRGARVAAIEARPPGVARETAAALGALEGAEVAAVSRAGKYLVLELAAAERRWQLMVHLGMTGTLLLRAAGSRKEPHTHLVLHWEDGRELHFRDPRRFGRVALAAAPEAGYAAALGVAPGREPLEVGEADFVDLFYGRRGPIKSALLNQKLLRGLGNIYADESLFRAAVDPRARGVSRPRLRRLRLAIREVLAEAIAAGGSSISDYLSSAGERGWFQLSHRVYGRTGEACAACGQPIRRVVIGGRSSHYCGRCQGR